MSTSVVEQPVVPKYGMEQSTTIKQTTSPGAVATTTTITTVPSQPAVNIRRTPETTKAWDAVTVLSDIFYFIGAILLIIGAGLILGYRYYAGAILYIISFSFWLLAAIFNVAQAIGKLSST